MNNPKKFLVQRHSESDAKAKGKKLSLKISRQISLLRAHGIVRKLPNQYKYALTDKGQKLSSVLNAVLSASTEDLVNLS